MYGRINPGWAGQPTVPPAVPLRLFTKGSSTLHSNESSGAGWWGAWVSYDVGRTPCNSKSQSIWSICIGRPTALDFFSVNIKLGPTFLFFLWLSILWPTGFAELKATTRMMWVSRICLFSTYFVNKIAPNRGIKLTTVHWGWHRWAHCTLSKYHPFHKSQTLLCHTEHKKSWMLTLIIVNSFVRLTPESSSQTSWTTNLSEEAWGCGGDGTNVVVCVSLASSLSQLGSQAESWDGCGRYRMIPRLI